MLDPCQTCFPKWEHTMVLHHRDNLASMALGMEKKLLAWQDNFAANTFTAVQKMHNEGEFNAWMNPRHVTFYVTLPGSCKLTVSTLKWLLVCVYKTMTMKLTQR